MARGATSDRQVLTEGKGTAWARIGEIAEVWAQIGEIAEV
jgi:hypothetical protein